MLCPKKKCFLLYIKRQNLFFWNINPWLRSDWYQIWMFILIDWTYLSITGKIYTYVEKLSQTILHINLVFANSDPVYNPKKTLRMYLMGLSCLKLHYLKKGKIEMKGCLKDTLPENFLMMCLCGFSTFPSER